MTKEEKAIYISIVTQALITAFGLAGIAWVLDNRIRRVETVVNTLPERMVKALTNRIGF